MNTDRLTTIIEPFCMFNLATFQSKGLSQSLFHLRNIQRDITLIDEFKNVVFARVELEYQNYSAVKKLLPHFVYEDSKSDVKDKILLFRNEPSAKSEKLSIGLLKRKEGGRAEEIWDWLSKHIKTSSIFRQFWLLRISLIG